MAIVKGSIVSVAGKHGRVIWLGNDKFTGQARVGIKFVDGTKFMPLEVAREVQRAQPKQQQAPAADPRRRNGFLHVDDMTPEERAEHEECMARMPIRAMCREMVRGIGGDQAADEFERMIDADL